MSSVKSYIKYAVKSSKTNPLSKHKPVYLRFDEYFAALREFNELRAKFRQTEQYFKLKLVEIKVELSGDLIINEINKTLEEFSKGA